MSEFLARKVKTYFKQFDVDHDGYVSLEDFTLLAERQCEAKKVDTAQREKLKACFVKVSYF